MHIKIQINDVDSMARQRIIQVKYKIILSVIK